MNRTSLRALAALAGLALVGCGSTVQVSGTTSAAATGLEQPGQAALPGTAASTAATAGDVPGVPGGSSASTTTPGRSAGVPSAGPVVPSGTARVTTPIQVGFMATKVGNAQSVGLNVGQTYSDKQAYEALVKEYNKEGGVAGRKILPVYGETDTANSDWSTQFQAACQHLTQDNKVQAVLGYVFVFLDSFEQCLARKGITHVYGGYQPGDVQAQKDLPSIVSVAHPTVDGMSETVLTGAMASGRLTKKSRLGILYDGCAHGDRAFARSTAPFLKRHGLTYEAFYMECAGGSGDVGSAAAAVKSAQLQFAARGVDVVYVPNAIELLLFMQNAESQGYRPQYLNQGAGAAFEANASIVPQAQMRNLHGYGWMPGIDVNQANQPYSPTPQQKACLAKLKQHGLVPQAFNDFMFAYVTCDSLDLYDRALRLTGGRSEGALVQRALVQVLPSFTGSSTYGGAFGVSSVQRGGPGRYRETSWHDSCSCFRYVGPLRRLPTV